jgi:hypothetical protein
VTCDLPKMILLAYKLACTPLTRAVALGASVLTVLWEASSAPGYLVSGSIGPWLSCRAWSFAALDSRLCSGRRSASPRYPALAGGPWLCRTVVLSLFHAVVVPSGCKISVQPQR